MEKGDRVHLLVERAGLKPGRHGTVNVVMATKHRRILTDPATGTWILSVTGQLQFETVDGFTVGVIVDGVDDVLYFDQRDLAPASLLEVLAASAAHNLKTEPGPNL